MMQREFCYICGHKVTYVRQNVWHCSRCGQDYYANPKATVDIALFNDRGEVLLCERGADPAKGKFDLPGGFVDGGETLEEALLRELEEELGLTKEDMTVPRYCLSYTSNYPWGKEDYDLISIMYTAKLLSPDKARPADDVASVKFMNPGNIDANDLSFHRLKELINQAARSVSE